MPLNKTQTQIIYIRQGYMTLYKYKQITWNYMLYIFYIFEWSMTLCHEQSLIFSHKSYFHQQD